MKRLYDVSPVLKPTTAVFPGDRPLRREVLLDRTLGDSVTLSCLSATVHLGAHVDAPSHYADEGPTIDRLDLSRLLGPCRVVRVPGAPGSRVTTAEVDAAWRASGASGRAEPGAPARLLMATGSFPDPERWTTRFRSVDPGVFAWLAAKGVSVLGIDTPSVDPAESKDLPAHAAAWTSDVLLLEGLVLADVPEGDYELIALPLRLEGFDASPVRAVLRTL